MRGSWTIVLLTLSNVFMMLAWCGHPRFKDHPVLTFKQETFRWNHALVGVPLVTAVWLVFKK